MNTPQEVIENTIKVGIKKYEMPWRKIFLLGILAGIYIAMGGLLSSLCAAGVNGWTTENPIISKLLAGITFPLGLILVVLVGAELFTGNTANLVPATMRGKIPPTYIWCNWCVVFAANFVGAFLFDYFMVYQTEILSHPDYRAFIVKTATYKVSLDWWVVFLRGIGANWFVCLAVWLGFSTRSMAGRLIGLWLPVMAFVAIGFEHSIANMFYIPTGMLYGADISWGSFLWNNLIPSTLGNIVGGAVFVGTAYTYIYSSTSQR